MKIAYLTAGASGMYCGSCIHDNTLARTMQQRGADLLLLPCYTPTRVDESNASVDKVFLSGLNVYLQAKYPIFRKMPRWVDRFFESKWLLNLIGKISVSTDANEIGDMLLTVIEGEAGGISKEVEKLITWLRDEYQPDLVVLTNTMLVGFTKRIKEELDVPVISWLQGEDIFLDDLSGDLRDRTFNELTRRLQQVDGFLVHSEYYKDYMPEYLSIDRDKIHVIPLGLDLEDHGHGTGPAADAPFTIGYLARRAPEKGLSELVDAFIAMADRIGPERIYLKVAGYLAPKDKQYYQDQVDKIAQAGLSQRVDWIGEVDRQGKIDLLQSIHVLSIPSPYREPKGLPILEAMANHVPVVEPDHGAFPEMMQKTEGGLLYKPGSRDQLVESLCKLMDDPDLRKELGTKGRAGVEQHYVSDQTADLTFEVFKSFAQTKEREKTPAA